MKTLLWLDDYRDPLADNGKWLVFSPIPRENLKVVWCKNYDDFVEEITYNGLPDAICFDHDLGLTGEYYEENNLPAPEIDKTGYDCAKWLVDYCFNKQQVLPPYSIQSANPVGKENIDKVLQHYIKNYTKLT